MSASDPDEVEASRPGRPSDVPSDVPKEQPRELVKIGDFARLAGTNLRTLRYYEELGLLQPASRSEGGFRYYRQTDLNRLELIRNLQELGLPLERIRDLLETRGKDLERNEWMCRVREALAEQQRLVAARIDGLERQRQKLLVAQLKLSQCENCPHTPRPSNNFCEPCQHTGEALPEHLSALF